ncbi:MAG: Crp/Fnr family transcriptional regulator [Clostridia bacterium]|nr:Crp/Fnr family transcriptional regulator [Clostridia bacterium]
MTKAECKLFYGMEKPRLEAFLDGIRAVKQSYGDGQVILSQGEPTDKLGVVLNGEIEGVYYGTEGDTTLVSTFGEGMVFADFLAADSSKTSPVTLSAVGECTVLHIPIEGLFSPPKAVEAEARRMLWNLVGIYSAQYFELKDRLFCLSAGTLREKILRFLSLQREKAGSDSFVLGCTRERMAAYLNAERSALCRELSRMRADGILACSDKKFSLKV